MSEVENQELVAGAARPVPNGPEYQPEQIDAGTPHLDPPGCRSGARGHDPCGRVATVMHGELPVCEPHYVLADLSKRHEHWGLALEIIEGWLRVAREWKHDDLIRMTESMIGEIKGHQNHLIDLDMDVHKLLGQRD